MKLNPMAVIACGARLMLILSVVEGDKYKGFKDLVVSCHSDVKGEILVSG
ncbi:hypothetical protein GCM10007922_19260 [Shewanella decolorationis]|nr:hypothetical protein GCM10007922_19260 [Shewanella decolorationis]